MFTSVDVSNCFRITGVYTAFEEWIQSDYFYAGERHNFWELVFVLDGRVGITAEEDARVMEAGQGILHSPMEFHRVWYAGVPARILIFSFDAAEYPVDSRGSFSLQDHRGVHDLLTKTRQTFQMNGISAIGIAQEPDAQMVVKEWELLLLELQRQKTNIRRIPRTRPAKNYAAIVRVLEQNLHRNLSVAEIAVLCSMSPVSVKQTFSRYAGMGVMNYFNRLKIQAATVMLADGVSVQETAIALGFSSQNYFSTVFKRIQGVSPTYYKCGIMEKC